MSHIWVAEEYGFDPSHPQFVADPYACYAQMQEASTHLWSQALQMWLVPRFEECNRLLRNPSLARVFPRRQPEERWETFNWLNDHAMLDTEGATHTRMRRLLSPQFTRVGLAGLEQAVQQVCLDLVADVSAELTQVGRFDLVTRIAEQLPVRVVCSLLGIPPQDQDQAHDWSLAMVRLFEYSRSAEDDERGIAGARAFAAYVQGLMDAGEYPTTAMLTLAQAVADGALNEREAVANAILLFNGGTGATINALGNGLALLLADEALRDEVIAERAWERAVEEFLRYEAPLQLFERQVVKDAEDLGLAGVRDGDRVGLLLGAANRDPSRYAEPHRFDPLRPVQPHLSFSAGTHFCLGAPLARMELQRIVEELLTALPGLRLAAAPVPERTYVVRGHQRIDVSD
jgi:cytochrome P450